MLQVISDHPLQTMEAAVRRAAHQHGANVVTVMHAGQLLHEANPPQDAVLFGICQPELHAALIAADIRAAVFLPCRIAAFVEHGHVVLTAISPVDLCRFLNRPDLAPLAAPLESLLLLIMEEAAQSPAAAHVAAAGHRAGMGATEDQVNLRGSIPQRIDRKGTKVEDMAGTGEHDAQGG